MISGLSVTERVLLLGLMWCGFSLGCGRFSPKPPEGLIVEAMKAEWKAYMARTGIPEQKGMMEGARISGHPFTPEEQTENARHFQLRIDTAKRFQFTSEPEEVTPADKENGVSALWVVNVAYAYQDEPGGQWHDGAWGPAKARKTKDGWIILVGDDAWSHDRREYKDGAWEPTPN